MKRSSKLDNSDTEISIPKQGILYLEKIPPILGLEQKLKKKRRFSLKQMDSMDKLTLMKKKANKLGKCRIENSNIFDAIMEI
jgi:hypothetical protein